MNQPLPPDDFTAASTVAKDWGAIVVAFFSGVFATIGMIWRTFKNRVDGISARVAILEQSHHELRLKLEGLATREEIYSRLDRMDQRLDAALRPHE